MLSVARRPQPMKGAVNEYSPFTALVYTFTTLIAAAISSKTSIFDEFKNKINFKMC